ncbi:MAG: Gfo/Idh/MocA family oxidoreductase [Planctomycetes bacterium]|jgi:predicted dehydrogenase|nr:Gfo/Idh/MocA family oxidoreductase [Planctomycetota bacterium]
MRIGIIGAENSHTAAIAKTINVDKLVKGFTVDYVWGETTEFAKAAAEKGAIPNIVADPSEMLGKIDALIVDHRHPKYHLAPALPFVRKGVPTFIDKPFCYRSDEGKQFIEEAKKAGAPITSFSVLPHQKSFARFVKKLPTLGNILAAGTYGASDLESPYGGVFFYGIHQIDMALIAFGYNVKSVVISKNGNGNTGQLFYDDGKIVTVDLITKGAPGFGIRALGEKGMLASPIPMDPNAYLTGIRTFTKMFRTGKEPVKHEHMLKPVLVLEALERSVASGKVESVNN